MYMNIILNQTNLSVQLAVEQAWGMPPGLGEH